MLKDVSQKKTSHETWTWFSAQKNEFWDITEIGPRYAPVWKYFGMRGMGQLNSFRASAPSEEMLRRAWLTRVESQPKIGWIKALWFAIEVEPPHTMIWEHVGEYVQSLHRSLYLPCPPMEWKTSRRFCELLGRWAHSPPKFSKQYCRIFFHSWDWTSWTEALKLLHRWIF